MFEDPILMRTGNRTHAAVAAFARRERDPRRDRRCQVPRRVDAVLVPRRVTRITGRLVKDQSAINNKLRTENTYHRIQQRFVRCQTIGPRKKQMQVIETPPITFAAERRHCLEPCPILTYFRRREYEIGRTS